MTIDIIHLWVIIISILKADMYMIHHLSWYIDILCSILNYDHDSTLTLSSNLQSLYSYFHISSLFSYLYDLFNDTLHIDLDAYQVQLATNKDLSSYNDSPAGRSNESHIYIPLMRMRGTLLLIRGIRWGSLISRWRINDSTWFGTPWEFLFYKGAFSFPRKKEGTGI